MAKECSSGTSSSVKPASSAVTTRILVGLLNAPSGISSFILPSGDVILPPWVPMTSPVYTVKLEEVVFILPAESLTLTSTS